METTKAKAAGALAATLAAGGMAGALLFTPVASSAQDSTTTTEQGATSTTEEGSRADVATREERRAEHEAEREERAAGLAEVLGISVDELRTAREDGQTIAQIAEANGVELQTVTDYLVDQATARLEQRIAELPEHVDALVNGELPDREGGFGHRHRGGR